VTAPDTLLTPLDGDIPPECGSKARNLARLKRLGYRVPPGMVVVDGAFQQHLEDAGVEDRCRQLASNLASLGAGEIRQESAAIRAQILKTPLRQALREQLARADQAVWLEKPLAVRSSAACEDTHDASYAGQLDSLLGVASLERLDEAIRAVWASLWSERSLFYARHRGFGAMRMGVIVQEQVDSRHSGVLFTRDPVAVLRSDEAVIEYTAGLGDRLVAGELTPRRARVRHRDLTVARDDTGGTASGPDLPDATLQELARIGCELEQKFGAPQDVEWSVDGDNHVVLLQARPVTAAGSGADRIVWSNANIAENFPGVVSPFLYSIVSRGYTAYFRNLGLGFGISRWRIAAMSAALDNIVGLHAGRLYYNLSNIHTALYLAPGGPWLARWFNQFTGAREFPNVAQFTGGAVSRTIELARVVARTTWQYLWVGWRIARFECAVDRYAESTRPERLKARALPELAADLRGFLEIRLRRWNDAALADTAAMVCCGALKYLLPKTAAPLDDETVHGNLLSGLAGLASARPISELWKLSREIRADAGLRALYATATAAEIASRLAAPEYDGFRGRFDRYLEVWGFRYSQELMLTNPTPQEDPLPVVRLLQSYARETGPGPDDISTRQKAIRERATVMTAARLTPAGWWRWLPLSRAGRFRLVLRAAQGSILLRERARMKQALLYTRLRHVVLRAGGELARQGFIERGDDVFLLAVDEVLALIEGTFAPDVARETIKQRRREQDQFSGIEPPDSFVLDRGAKWQPGAAAPAVSEGKAGDALRGSCACGGRVEGNAAVVLDVREADRVRAGDILVTRQTDPGWAAVFFLIKGLIIERGGMLSHGAIIAREYGIPAVVGVPRATQLIRTGDRLRVDGDKGVVEFCRN
jgi:pyruvate,water dikinase